MCRQVCRPAESLAESRSAGVSSWAEVASLSAVESSLVVWSAVAALSSAALSWPAESRLGQESPASLDSTSSG